MHAIDGSEDLRGLAESDLNLLVALHALLSTSSVTEASARLGRTQSSTSHALKRLRETLGDPLFVRSGRGLTRTPRGEALLAEVELALQAAARVFRAPPEFDPRTNRRELTIACPDLLVPLLPALLSRIAAKAPGVRLSLQLPPSDLDGALASGAIDLAISAEVDTREPALLRARLGHVRMAVAARRGHPALRKRGFDVARWTAYAHVVVRTGSGGPNLLEEALSRAGVERRIGFVAPSFLAALHVAAVSDLFVAAPEPAGRALAPRLGLKIVPLPIAMPAVPIAAFWHERVQRDPGHVWLRERLCPELVALIGPRKVARGAPARDGILRQ